MRRNIDTFADFLPDTVKQTCQFNFTILNKSDGYETLSTVFEMKFISVLIKVNSVISDRNKMQLFKTRKSSSTKTPATQ